MTGNKASLFGVPLDVRPLLFALPKLSRKVHATPHANAGNESPLSNAQRTPGVSNSLSEFLVVYTYAPLSTRASVARRNQTNQMNWAKSPTKRHKFISLERELSCPTRLILLPLTLLYPLHEKIIRWDYCNPLFSFSLLSHRKNEIIRNTACK